MFPSSAIRDRYLRSLCSRTALKDSRSICARASRSRLFPDSIIAPVDDSEASGKDIELSGKLGSFLDGESINSRSDDDKTLVLAVRR